MRALIADGKLVDDGATKGKRYKKADEPVSYTHLDVYKRQRYGK